MKLKVSGSGFTDLDNNNLNWHSDENIDVKQWLSEGNIPEPEFTEEELATIELNKKISEAKQYLANTDFKMTVDYFGAMTEQEQEEVIDKRAEVREFIRANQGVSNGL